MLAIMGGGGIRYHFADQFISLIGIDTGEPRETYKGWGFDG